MQSSYYTLTEQRRVSLLLPGLLSAEVVATIPEPTPYLCRFLSHATVTQETSDSLESAVLNWFNGWTSEGANCAAIAGYRFDTGRTEVADTVLRADPVYQAMDINHAILSDQSVMDLTLPEAQSIAETINRHFEADGLTIEVIAPTRWYGHFKQPLNIHTNPPGKATGRDVSQESPTGTDASRWRRWLAEIEMLLYSHPVNQHRQQAGKVAVNSLWLWGEGNPEGLSTTAATRAAVYGDHHYTQSLAHYLGMDARSLEHFSAANKEQPLSVLVADDHLHRAAVTADTLLWANRLLQLESNVFKPLWQNLGRGGWQSARLWLGATKWMTIDAGARYKFWRKQQPLSRYVDHAEV